MILSLEKDLHNACLDIELTRHHRPGVHKVFTIPVLDDAEIIIDVLHKDLAGGLTALVPWQKLPDGPDRHIELPNDIAHQWQSRQTRHLAAGCVIHHHGQFAFLLHFAGCGRHNAASKSGQQFEPSENWDDREAENRCIEFAVQVLLDRIDALRHTADLRHAPGAGLQLVQSKEEVGLGFTVDFLLLSVLVGILNGQEEWRRTEDAMRDSGKDELPFALDVFQRRWDLIGVGLQQSLDLLSCDLHGLAVVFTRCRVVGLTTIESRTQLQYLSLGHFRGRSCNC
mmetsp:Transcript_15532/g.42913  ORF Transcript_15532/g.42913 Transcript_15532/m.42913 type:complete len:283 (-) Transcript_15532:290-1138(-)